MDLHWQHSLSARVARRRYHWAWRSAVVWREMRRKEGTQIAAADVIALENPNPDKLKLELQRGLQLQPFNASELTDRSGGGSFTSHDAATDTGRKPAPTHTIYGGQGNTGKTFNAEHSTFNAEVAVECAQGSSFEDEDENEEEMTNYDQ